MITLQRILCPTDFSGSAAQARRYACELARVFEAELHVVHTVHRILHETPEFGMGLDSPFTLRQDSGRVEKLESEVIQKMTEEIDSECHPGAKLTFSVLWGQPYAEILDYAKTHDVDLIVMGSHGRSGLPRAILGSVAERVIRMAPCPVLTVRSQESK